MPSRRNRVIEEGEDSYPEENCPYGAYKDAYKHSLWQEGFHRARIEDEQRQITEDRKEELKIDWVDISHESAAIEQLQQIFDIILTDEQREALK